MALGKIVLVIGGNTKSKGVSKMYAVSAICLNGFAHTKLFQLRIAAQLYALALVVSGYKAVIIEY